MTVNNQYKWTLHADWYENVIITSEDSGERSESYDFDTEEQLRQFEIQYRGQHQCWNGEPHEYLFDVREVTIRTPEDNCKRAAHEKHLRDTFKERLRLREKRGVSTVSDVLDILGREKNIDK